MNALDTQEDNQDDQQVESAEVATVRGRRTLKELLHDPRGATMLEWTMLLALIGIPAYAITRLLLSNLTSMYQMITTLNGLPLP